MAGTRLRGGSRLCRRHTFGVGFNPVAPGWYYGKTRRQYQKLVAKTNSCTTRLDKRDLAADQVKSKLCPWHTNRARSHAYEHNRATKEKGAQARPSGLTGTLLRKEALHDDRVILDFVPALKPQPAFSFASEN
jgi:hypothetical protein